MASHRYWPPILCLLGLLGAARGNALSPGAHGFIGFGITLYDPACAWACNYAISAPLNCTTADLAIAPESRHRSDEEAAKPVYPSGDGWAIVTPATPTCRSRNQFYLQTLAYCLKSHCHGMPVSKLDEYWEANLVELPDGSGPKSYMEVLSDIKQTPTKPINATDPLTYAAVLPKKVFALHLIDVEGNRINEYRNSLYSLIIVLSAAVIPIAVSLLRFLPWPAAWVTKFHAYLIDPPLFGSKHSTPVWGLGIMPTRGQAIFILYLWVVNVTLSSVGYDTRLGTWYETVQATLMRSVAKRLGVLSYANVPLVILYAGRNNFLLWVTNWSHSTFLLLHRWAAFICMLHAVLHSLIFLEIALHSEGWSGKFTSPNWYWGCGGTIGFVVLIIKSIQPIRRRMYEIFLIAHIIIVALVIVSLYKHVQLNYTDAYGYQNWMWLASVIWGFDRLVRMVRWLLTGFKRAYLTPIDEDYYRLDIPGLSADGHVYLHFPTLSTWKFWESHPFSIAGMTNRETGPIDSATLEPAVIEETEAKAEKNIVAVGSSSGSGSGTDSESVTGCREPGATLFIRRQNGLTAGLAAKGACVTGIPVFVEGSYNRRATFLQEDSPEPSHNFPNLLCIAGGVGITGVLPALDRFQTVGKPLGSKKLFWGARTWPLVREVERMRLHGQSNQGTATERRWGDVDVRLAVGERFDMRRVLTEELRQQQGGTVVVVCGSPAMVDDVRCIVSALGRHSENGKPVVVKLMVESFTW